MNKTKATAIRIRHNVFDICSRISVSSCRVTRRRSTFDCATESVVASSRKEGNRYGFKFFQSYSATEWPVVKRTVTRNATCDVTVVHVVCVCEKHEFQFEEGVTHAFSCFPMTRYHQSPLSKSQVPMSLRAGRELSSASKLPLPSVF